MRRLWSASGRWFARVPERDPSQGVAWLLVGCLTIASGFMFSGHDTAGIAHSAVALYAFVDATLHFMPDDRLREKVALRGGGLSFLLVVALPLIIVDLCASPSGVWLAAILLAIFAPVLVLFLCLEYAYRRQRSRSF